MDYGNKDHSLKFILHDIYCKFDSTLQMGYAKWFDDRNNNLICKKCYGNLYFENPNYRNREYCLAWRRDYYARNIEYIRAYQLDYHAKTHPVRYSLDFDGDMSGAYVLG